MTIEQEEKEDRCVDIFFLIPSTITHLSSYVCDFPLLSKVPSTECRN